ncbi:MAG: hypothetical protein QOF02_4145 [Blastocatellia bacterium]|jgi:hypothetical protein|nr:hypothetical protein [Blastocatellia bacterium]
MSEIGIGILFAFWFVMAYLLVAKLVGPRMQRIAVWRHWMQPSFDAAQLAGGKRPQLFLTTEALSQHHSRAGAQQPRAGESRPATDKDRRGQ